VSPLFFPPPLSCFINLSYPLLDPLPPQPKKGKADFETKGPSQNPSGRSPSPLFLPKSRTLVSCPTRPHPFLKNKTQIFTAPHLLPRSAVVLTFSSFRENWNPQRNKLWAFLSSLVSKPMISIRRKKGVFSVACLLTPLFDSVRLLLRYPPFFASSLSLGFSAAVFAVR